MVVTEHEYFNGTTTNKNTLELEDFNYLSNEFTIKKDSLGFVLTSIKDENLSISINKFGIKYDRDISARRMMLATERIDIPKNILYDLGTDVNYFKQYLPTTSDSLGNLINEFKFNGIGNTKINDVINFIKN